ncbi:MAG TPA: hypothetical protein VGR87_09905 [Candidatus Limnocylindria bacterium]|jgi:hypothetical protein|nr:hypothetical protein [Candidatus Limnocylindria bacterium]
MSDDQLEALLNRLERAMPKMTPSQRERVARHVLERDPDLALALPALVTAIRTAKRVQLPLRRDSVG